MAQPKKPDTPLEVAIREMRPGLGVAMFFSLFINVLMFVGPMYMLQVYDRVLTSRSEATLVSLTVIAALLLILYAFLEFIRSRVLVRCGKLFDEQLGEKLFNAVFKGALRLPQGGHAQAMRDMDTVREFFTGSAILAFFDAPWVPLYIAACFLLHPMVGLVSLIGAVIIFVLAIVNEMTTKQGLARASSANIRANNYVSTSLKNAEVLQAMGMIGAIRKRWRNLHEQLLGWQALSSDRAGVIQAASKFVRMFLQTAILGVGAYLVLEDQMTPGLMIAGSILMGRALAPVDLAVGSWKAVAATRVARERINTLLAALPEDAERMSLPEIEGNLALEAVVAGAPGSRVPVLKNITFNLPKGQSLGVIGPSAAGKSSLARVLVGVWPVGGGAVRLDGSDIRHWNPEELGEYIGYVPQDVELFGGSVAENIARFGDVDPDLVVKAAKDARVHDMIQQLPNGYDTQIGDGGAVLSGGQRQRIALARALYNDPAFIVLDEPNASLDSQGEELLAKSILDMKASGKTVVVITHRANLLSIVDNIMVMANGAISNFGPRAEILAAMSKPQKVANPGSSVAQIANNPV